MGRDAFTVLGVGADADDEAIAFAYRAMARQFHPDVAGDTATRRMMEVNAAFDRVRTAERRAEYLAELGTSGTRVPRTAPAAGHDVGGDGLRWRPERDGTGGAGPPPGRPSGSVLDFGRHLGWSLGEIARVDPGYLRWLADKREGSPYLAEIERLLGQMDPHAAAATGGRRRSRFGR